MAKPPPEWKKAAEIVRNHVPKGKCTTYGAISEAIYGEPNKGRAVGSMMRAWETEEPDVHLAHRVVDDDGSIPEVRNHRDRLQSEGVGFTTDGKVDLGKFGIKLGNPYSPR